MLGPVAMAKSTCDHMGLWCDAIQQVSLRNHSRTFNVLKQTLAEGRFFIFKLGDLDLKHIFIDSREFWLTLNKTGISKR